MFYDDDLGTENIFFPVCLISEYASFTINVYLYSIHLGIWNVTAVFQFPFKREHLSDLFFRTPSRLLYVTHNNGGDTRMSDSYEALVRVHDTRSRGETIESGELRE